MPEVEQLIEIYKQLEDAGLMVVAGKKDTAELMVSHDVVPVVRCKDCKHRVLDTVNGEDWCNHTLGLCAEVYATDFCSYGERRTDEKSISETSV